MDEKQAAPRAADGARDQGLDELLALTGGTAILASRPPC
jgi:hypothetical protein